MSISDSLIAIQAGITAISEIKQCDFYDGTLDKDESIKNISIIPPAVLVTCVRSSVTAQSTNDYAEGSLGPDTRESDYTFMDTASFAVSLIVKDEPLFPRAPRAWELATKINRVLIPRAARNVAWRNAYSQELYDNGLFLLSATWDENILNSPPPQDRYTPAKITADNGASSDTVWPREQQVQ
ncbi:hypothetical protein NQX30_04820 [Candidatus Persebacteraceae bacterium Df01]|uniref:Uncharacterized protein n=1 Tax=Candidatus Doriopsillibacter californiensis TaxID=2970740 RepID=A0ABT7QME0_9GAMM|nr:hypothetical protein [Candidatus Persebacteraceae bacterium Df01]